MTEEIQHGASGEPAEESEQLPANEIAEMVPQSPDDDAPQSASNRAVAYAVVAVVLGLLAGGGFAATALRGPGRTGSDDLGNVVFSAGGLKGHLVLNWNKKLTYRLAVEPSDATRNAAFAQVVTDPPRPLSVAIELKDSGGYALCMKTVELKFDPAQAASDEALTDGTASGSGGKSSANQPAQTAEMARLEAKEVEREYGQDIFHNGAGPDGQIESINAAGEIACSSQDYAATAGWSFSPDFPSMDEQDAQLKRQTDTVAQANRALAESAAVRAATRRNSKKKAVEGPGRFAIEGDDELVGFDPSRGIAKTSTQITFILSAKTAGAVAAKWQDLPADIHYKCDMNNACTLTRRGAMVLNAQLKR